MAYSTPRTWVASEYPTAAQMNANVRDNVSFLANPPSCRAYRSTNQTITTATDTVVLWTAEDYDTAALHSTSTNTGRITIPATGVYVVSTAVQFAGNATGFRQVYFRVNTSGAFYGRSGPAVNTAAAGSWVALTDQLKLTAGDYVETWVYQNSGGNLDLIAFGNSMFMAATWIGLG